MKKKFILLILILSSYSSVYSQYLDENYKEKIQNILSKTNLDDTVIKDSLIKLNMAKTYYEKLKAKGKNYESEIISVKKIENYSKACDCNNILLFLNTENKDCIEKCVSEEQANNKLLKAKKHIEKGTESDYKKALKFLKESAELGNTDSMVEIGDLFKYGRGCKLNYNKARKWYNKAAKLNNKKGSYSLGYIYYKGLGHIKQDYKKAIKWFKKSDTKMAKYWLGMAYKNGYGIDQNYLKAEKLLQNKKELVKAKKRIYTIDKNKEISIKDSIVLGEWEGELTKLDWSKKYIKEKYPLNIEILKEQKSNDWIAKIIFNKKTHVTKVFVIENTIYFENLTIKFPHESYIEGIPSELTYKLLSSEFKVTTTKKGFKLIGNLDTYIEQWNEPGMPLVLSLSKKDIRKFNPTQKPTAEKGTLKQFRLYPNPVENDLRISFELIKPQDVTIKIYTKEGVIIKTLKKKQLHKGVHNIYYDSSNLSKGLYLISVITDKANTKLIIKK